MRRLLVCDELQQKSCGGILFHGVIHPQCRIFQILVMFGTFLLELVYFLVTSLDDTHIDSNHVMLQNARSNELNHLNNLKVNKSTFFLTEAVWIMCL